MVAMLTPTRSRWCPARILGASGDLAPLANLALPIGAGQVLTETGAEPAPKAFERAGLAPVQLDAKEGLRS